MREGEKSEGYNLSDRFSLKRFFVSTYVKNISSFKFQGWVFMELFKLRCV